MANLFKRNVLESIPADAPIIERDGQRFARVTDGARAREREIVTTPKGDKIIVSQSREWYGKVKLASKAWKLVKLFTDKTASERRLAQLQVDADRRAAGMHTAETDKVSLPLKDLAKAFHDSLRVARRNAHHVHISEWLIGKMIDAGGWQRFSDITTASVEKILKQLSDAGKTASYQNKHLSRIRALVRWALPDGWPNPLAKLRRVNERGAKRTRERRAATRDELAALFALDLPEQRRLAYALAAYNGLRRNEVQGLKWENLKLSAPVPFVGIKQKQGTTDQLDYIPLHPYVLKLLKGKLAMPGVPVVGTVVQVRTMEEDWKRADVAFRDERNRRLDFHALRHTFQTEMDQAGCSRATKKKLMRHAAGDVTDGYAHAELAEMAVALSRLASPDEPQQQSVVKTGTTDQSINTTGNTSAHHRQHQTSGADCAREGTTDNLTIDGALSTHVNFTLENQGHGDDSTPQITSGDETARTTENASKNSQNTCLGLAQSNEFGRISTDLEGSAPPATPPAGTDPELRKLVKSLLAAWPAMTPARRVAVWRMVTGKATPARKAATPR